MRALLFISGPGWTDEGAPAQAMQDQLVNLESDVAAHPRVADLARLVATVAITAADERRVRLSDGLDELVGEADLDADAARIGPADLFETLRSDAPDAAGRRVTALLLARGVGDDPPADDAAADRLAQRLCWLAANSWLDALWAIEARLDDEGARRWWQALARLVRSEQERGLTGGRALALVAASALAGSSSAIASTAREGLAAGTDDPTLSVVLRRPSAEAAVQVGARPDGAEVVGELVPAPLSTVALVLQAVTGILLVRWVGRLLLRLLGCKRPARITVAGDRVTVATELSLLGKTLHQREHVIPIAALARAMREVRYPRLSLYAGLIALSLGTYFGASLATDGLRVGSPSLLGVGAAIIGLGVVVDLVFAKLVPAGKGSHHVVFVPRRGRKLALAVADAPSADRALRSLGG